MSDLVVFVPSRGRPREAAEVVDALRETCTADTRLVFAVDGDDPARDDYVNVAVLKTPGSAAINTQPSGTMVSALNKAALDITNTYPDTFAVAFMGDDHRPRTKGWDQAYLDALREMGTGIVYGNDLYQGEKLPTQVAMTSDIIRTLGYMAPPDLKHMYVDNAWLELGRAIGAIRYLPEVVVEHLHPVAGKGEWDEGYERVNAPEMYRRDRVVLEKWLRESLPVEAERIRQLMSR